MIADGDRDPPAAPPEELRAAMQAAESAFGGEVEDEDWERETQDPAARPGRWPRTTHGRPVGFAGRLRV